MISQAALEHLIDDSLQTRIDAFLLLILWQLGILNTQFGVMIDTLG